MAQIRSYATTENHWVCASFLRFSFKGAESLAGGLWCKEKHTEDLSFYLSENKTKHLRVNRSLRPQTAPFPVGFPLSLCGRSPATGCEGVKRHQQPRSKKLQEVNGSSRGFKRAFPQRRVSVPSHSKKFSIFLELEDCREEKTVVIVFVFFFLMVEFTFTFHGRVNTFVIWGLLSLPIRGSVSEILKSELGEHRTFS